MFKFSGLLSFIYIFCFCFQTVTGMTQDTSGPSGAAAPAGTSDGLVITIIDSSAPAGTGDVSSPSTSLSKKHFPHSPLSHSPHRRSPHSSFAGSIGSSISDAAINSFFLEYRKKINELVQTKVICSFAGVDCFAGYDDTEKAKTAVAMSMQLRVLLNRYQHRDQISSLFKEAQSFFIRLLFSLALLENAYAQRLDQDCADIKKITETFGLYAGEALSDDDRKKIDLLEDCVSSRILAGILKIHPERSYDSNARRKIVNLWFYYFHRSLVNVHQGDMLDRIRESLRQLLIITKTVRYKISQVHVQSCELRDRPEVQVVPELIWCNNEDDSNNMSWYDTPALVEQSLLEFEKVMTTKLHVLYYPTDEAKAIDKSDWTAVPGVATVTVPVGKDVHTGSIARLESKFADVSLSDKREGAGKSQAVETDATSGDCFDESGDVSDGLTIQDLSRVETDVSIASPTLVGGSGPVTPVVPTRTDTVADAGTHDANTGKDCCVIL